MGIPVFRCSGVQCGVCYCVIKKGGDSGTVMGAVVTMATVDLKAGETTRNSILLAHRCRAHPPSTNLAPACTACPPHLPSWASPSGGRQSRSPHRRMSAHRPVPRWVPADRRRSRCEGRPALQPQWPRTCALCPPTGTPGGALAHHRPLPDDAPTQVAM